MVIGYFYFKNVYGKYKSRPQNRSKFIFFSSAKVLLTLCISAMVLVALQNSSLIDVLCNRKYCLYVKLIISVFILHLIISTIHKKSWQSHQIYETLPRKFVEFPQNFCVIFNMKHNISYSTYYLCIRMMLGEDLERKSLWTINSENRI